MINDRRELIQDIDSIPFPAYDMFNMEHYVLYSQVNSDRSDRGAEILSGRGCPFRCNFCYRMDMGNNVFCGVGSTIIDKISICDDVVIGAGAVVIEDIVEPGTYVGIPAKEYISM